MCVIKILLSQHAGTQKKEDIICQCCNTKLAGVEDGVKAMHKNNTSTNVKYNDTDHNFFQERSYHNAK